MLIILVLFIMNTETIQVRIKMIIEDLKLNNRTFAIHLGVDPTVIHNIVTGRKSQPSFAVLEKVVLSFDNIDAKWLLTGKGNMYTASVNKTSMVEENATEYGRTTNEIALESEVINLKGQIEAYKNVITSLTINLSGNNK